MNYFNAILDERERAIELEREEMEKSTEKKAKTEEARKVKNILPSTFSESVFLLDGRPFRLVNRDYLCDIYDLDIEQGLLMCGRQVEKSTTFSTKISNDTLLHNFYRALYFAPLNEQVKVFSEDRLGRLFKYSQNDVIQKEFMDKDDKQNVFNKSFGKTGGLIYLRHCYGNGDNVRGISANGVYGDEIQDILVDALPVISETQAHARDLGPGIKITWYAGTPKTYSNTIQYLWDKSKQMEWVVRCLHCGTDQILGEKNIAPGRYVCRHCGKELTTFNIAKNARWVKLNSAASTYGFRITQMMSPSMTAADVHSKMLNYPKNKFYNEVLGRSYEHAQKPMPRHVLMRIVKPDMAMLPGRVAPFISSPITAGIDWGHGTGSFTILVIKTLTPEGRFRTIFTKKYKVGMELDTAYQLQDIIGHLNRFGVNYIIADYGDGFQQGQVLKKMYGPMFDMCYYSWNQKDLVAYESKNGFWVVNRDKCLFWYVEDIKNGREEWPGYEMDLIMHMIEDHEVVQIEYRTTETKSPDGNVAQQRSNDMMFTHPAGKPDDSFHASHYASFAMKMLLRMPIDPTSAFNAPEFGGAYTGSSGTVL